MELLIYLLKVSACMTLLFAFYLLVPRKLTFFKLNRFYLLGSLLLSFGIPAIEFTIEKEMPQQVNASMLPAMDTTAASLSTPAMSVITTPVGAANSFDWYILLPYLYGAVVLCLLLTTFWKLAQLLKYTRTQAAKINGLKLVPKSMGFTNCSFFNYVFIDEQRLSNTELEVLLKHEEVHAKQLHSIDKILMMVVKAVLWFNPIVYLYDKALEEAHEYEADETTSKNFGTGPYASLLLKLAVEKNAMPLVHNFVKSPIKQRIKMLFSGKSTSIKKLVYLLILPIGLGLIWGFTIKVVEVAPKTLYTNANLSADSLSIFKGAVKSMKRIEYLTPRIISSESIFISEGGVVNHYKAAKIKLFDGLLSAKDVVLNNKLNTLLALNANYVFNNGYTTKGDTIEFDLTKGVTTVKNAVKALDESKPKLISSASVRVDVKSDISYVKNGIIEVGGDQLKAEEIAWDPRNGLLTAKTATLRLATGKVVSDEYIIYDIKKRTYTTNSTPDNRIHVKSAAYQLLSKLTFEHDSIKIGKSYNMIFLRGNVKINVDGYTLSAKLITADYQSNALTTYYASLTDKEGKVVKAEELQFDILTKAYKIIKP